MSPPAKDNARAPVLTFDCTLGEFVGQFCDAAAGRPPEQLAALVWRMRFETVPARYVRDNAARLVRNHCAKHGMDAFAADVLLQAISQLGLEEGQ
jgi:hypothetical protein